MKPATPRVDYFDDTHQYFVNGVEVPSVSKLVTFATGDTLKDIPKEVLRTASVYGTAVHNAIEKFEKSGEVQLFFDEIIGQYNELKAQAQLDIADMEQIITDGKYYAGRYDILAKNGYLFDIKTNSKPMMDKWSWQLSLYYHALGEYKEKGYILYLPKKGKHKLIEVPTHRKNAVIALVKMYYEKHITNRNG